jgi:NAD+ kinase
VIAIGGDGAMLRAARVCAPYSVPVLGVNMGHLGFLTEVSPPISENDKRWAHQLDRIQNGDFWIEERMMIRATVMRASNKGSDGEREYIDVGEALNDVVISRTQVTRMILLETYIDRHWTTTYNCDALIIATATGSTAYALAVDGPILPPELRNILIVPVAPHLSMDRPIVLSQGATVEVRIGPETKSEIALALDGAEVSDLHHGDSVCVQAGEHVGRFVRLRPRNYFYRSLLDRLEPRLPGRSKPEQLEI